MKAMGTVLTNKYAEGLPEKRYYGGVRGWWMNLSNWPLIMPNSFCSGMGECSLTSGAQANASSDAGLLEAR